ncbi:hypothetical protein HYH03_004687 [Edaphochlamys debaryana]|uniref:Uncharacterized protein n=1 Tax=Edaphochlamys debaryana TaxID=47281 RepID=A0A836C1N3_9CHLO|nr:hypothetical protein HYH03_004687 [Edaphochlamys debaryana]|eukprot:KAG2497096.1 hypothetical protein HYH03_004687 [Edaphochlamys debaryana]
MFHGTLRGKATAGVSNSHCLFRAYVLAVGPNCADDGVRRKAYEAARQAALEAGAPVGPAELPRRRGAASPGVSPAAGCRRGGPHTGRAGGGASTGAAFATGAAAAPGPPAFGMPWPCGGKRSAEHTRVEVACPAQSWSGATEDSDGHVRPSPPGAGTRLVTKVVDSAGSLRHHHAPFPCLAGAFDVSGQVLRAASTSSTVRTWPGFEHEATPVTPAAPLSASGAWPRSVAGALPTAAEPSGGGLTTGLQPPPLPPLGAAAAAAAAAALLPPRLASAPAAAWGLAAAAPSATDPRAQGPRQEPWASPYGSPYASYAAAHAASYPRLGRLLQPTPHAAAAPALPWAQGPPLRAPASPWGPPYGADGWPQPSACSLPGVGSAPGPTKPRNPPVGAPWPFQPPWAHAAPAPVPPGAAALQAAQGPYTDPLGGGSDLGVPWDVTDDLDSVMLDAWLAMRSD